MRNWFFFFFQHMVFSWDWKSFIMQKLNVILTQFLMKTWKKSKLLYLEHIVLLNLCNCGSNWLHSLYEDLPFMRQINLANYIFYFKFISIVNQFTLKGITAMFFLLQLFGIMTYTTLRHQINKWLKWICFEILWCFLECLLTLMVPCVKIVKVHKFQWPQEKLNCKNLACMSCCLAHWSIQRSTFGWFKVPEFTCNKLRYFNFELTFTSSK